jgi:hypothetical protein
MFIKLIAPTGGYQFILYGQSPVHLATTKWQLVGIGCWGIGQTPKYPQEEMGPS